MTVTGVVPIRSFDGLTRLEPTLQAAERRGLMRRLADRTTDAATNAGVAVAVVSGSDEVQRWARNRGYAIVDEPDPPGLDAAASAGIAGAPSAWMVIHADLPAVAVEDIAAAVEALDSGKPVLAPSHDGGTSVIGGSGATFPFSYGVGSFHRHLAAAPDAKVLTRPGLALDLDGTRDLVALRSLSVI